MPDIRYVCLSDMHLAADNSVLTRIQPGSIATDTTTPSPVLTQLVACLRELIAHNESKEKPTLILNGDILELALAETNEAAMVFERFIELIFPKDGEALFDKNIIYLPGNHDHHLWENARETQYVNFIDGIPPGSHLEIPWHTTKMFSPDLVRGYFVTDLIQRYPHLKDAVISIVYPNYALVGSDGQKCVIFSHGHYVESLYSLMSTLNTMIFPKSPGPKVIYDLEADNFAWIDFFWSTMARSGDVGHNIGLLYDKLQDKNQLGKLITNLSASLVKQYNHLKFAEGIETRGLAWILGIILGGVAEREKHQPVLLSPDAQHGLHLFIETMLLAQIRTENKQNIPADITFIFGHTHKPFSQEMNFTGYPASMNVYNSGGWVVDTVQPTSIYGAAVILVDETLQPISLRMYNQATSAADYNVRVEESTRQGATSSPFHDRISALVNPASEPWKSFSATVAEAVGIHAQVLQTKINL